MFRSMNLKLALNYSSAIYYLGDLVMSPELSVSQFLYQKTKIKIISKSWGKRLFAL